jgi:hypothetical protein
MLLIGMVVLALATYIIIKRIEKRKAGQQAD